MEEIKRHPCDYKLNFHSCDMQSGPNLKWKPECSVCVKKYNDICLSVVSLRPMVWLNISKVAVTDVIWSFLCFLWEFNLPAHKCPNRGCDKALHHWTHQWPVDSELLPLLHLSQWACGHLFAEDIVIYC